MPQSSEYWKKRFEQIEQSQNRQGVQCYADIEKQYRQAQKQIEGQIASWYQRFAANNNITLAEAHKMLTAGELAEFKWDINQYIQYGEENAINGTWVKQLENASARFHVSRLEALKIQVQQSIEAMFGNQLDSIDSAMKGIYTSGYYKTAFEIQKGVGVGWNFATLDDKQIQKVINKPWAADGKNFSERVWGNRQKLVNELNTTLTQNIVLGKDPQKAIDEISRKMKTSKNVAGRLVMTEEAAFSSAAQKDCFAELDVEQFEIVATLDSHTSDICQDMDGKHFPMSQWEVGVTAPPFHVYCRSTTVPYFDDEFDSVGERAAKDADGNTYFVPSSMKYDDWKKSFVDGDKSGLQPVKEDDTMKLKEKVTNNNETVKGCVDTLEKLGVQYNQVSYHPTPLSESIIIESLSGGDKTKGSCASVGLAYVGQKNGLNVLDFRGGESQNFFSNGYNLKKITELPNITKISEIARSSVTSGKKLLTKVEEGNEYYFVCGRHAAIVRKNEGILQYLELQSANRSAWTDFNGNVRYTLANRFGETKGYDCESYMFNVQDANDSKELQVLLGYINTIVDEQKKGVGGSVK